MSAPSSASNRKTPAAPAPRSTRQRSTITSSTLWTSRVEPMAAATSTRARYSALSASSLRLRRRSASKAGWLIAPSAGLGDAPAAGVHDLAHLPRERIGRHRLLEEGHAGPEDAVIDHGAV